MRKRRMVLKVVLENGEAIVKNKDGSIEYRSKLSEEVAYFRRKLGDARTGFFHGGVNRHGTVTLIDQAKDQDW